MRIIEPYPVTEAMMVATNVPVESLPAWNVGTTYADKARVVFQTGIWESVQAANTGRNPGADTASEWWVRVGATNPWRAFDNRLGGMTTGGSMITYTIALPRTLNAICFFGLNATSVRIRVLTPGPTVIFDETIQLATRDPVGTFWEYIYTPFAFKPDLVLTDLRLPSGGTVEITVTAGTAAQVGEIMLGNDIDIGTTLEDSGLGIQDFSRKDRDEWGGLFLIPRPVIKTVSFRFSIPTDGAARVQKIMERIASKVCVFYAVDGEDPFGTTVAGILRDYDLTLTTGRSFGTIQAESLT
ncbi:hypothetical protein PARHAE_02043 [Paracoccus haematequi]|uniref:Carbohydrate binding domain protein n=1 Tax=Paracoccus haematequi TaxID=2491866 RepID=A0A447IMY3_9RHOB|nr:hypothetical protein [Paracoccus haematequi]VDS08858.1 hypothetical protein PARHAE_02043 [Paracoccus haematequi]